MSSPFENMSIADIEKLLVLRREQDRKAEEEKKRKEQEDQDRRDKERRDMEVELASSAKELEDEMAVESDRTGDVDVTPRAQRDLFRDSEEDEDTDEEDPEPDETSEDPKEKEWVGAHKETKSAEIHLATARGNLTTALYKHGYAPSEAADQMLVQRREELQSAVARLRMGQAQDTMLTTSVVARRRRAVEKAAAEQQEKEEGRERLAGAAWRKGVGKAPAPAEPWGGPGMECDT
jgi:aspartate beta-hydroxylase